MKPDGLPAGKSSIGAYDEHTANTFRGDNPIKDKAGRKGGIDARARGTEGAIALQCTGEFHCKGYSTESNGRVGNIPTQQQFTKQ